MTSPFILRASYPTPHFWEPNDWTQQVFEARFSSTYPTIPRPGRYVEGRTPGMGRTNQLIETNSSKLHLTRLASKACNGAQKRL